MIRGLEDIAPYENDGIIVWPIFEEIMLTVEITCFRETEAACLAYGLRCISAPPLFPTIFTNGLFL